MTALLALLQLAGVVLLVLVVLVGIPVCVAIAITWRQQSRADQARDTDQTVAFIAAVKDTPTDLELADRLATSRGRSSR